MRARRSVCATQPLKARRVTRDPIDEPKRGRRGRDITEQRRLITERAQVAQAVPAVGEHHREVTSHAALVVPSPPLLQPGKLARERPCQPAATSDVHEQHATGMRQSR